ncbi:hypothetical protein Back11_04010 [Paenibacillus baekrokdamisoli]|uniref:Uncharacterized protein n=1 Tax=Paenibacillus baekrokdamisoli TaxID=1712516 RepID=A0A3G9IL52_9BACL|nr:ABC transporter substrate-binding protein [Paenibacillus baekrokdamisoli]MBB3067762.1 iron complex transport system substrate-binding protein [Paenibacillus baekrokdamisoli]BBH19056.1 hypothetical protein Back11_04010 [Paenibacillus baekrokdamisoli]
MKQVRSILAVLALIVVMGVMLLGCAGGNKDENTAGAESGTKAGSSGSGNKTGSSSGAPESNSSEESATRSYTDYKGHKVVIPVAPKRVIFAGETTGDLIELGIQPVGIFGGTALKGRLYEHELTQAEDIGFPINLEKVTSLNPDFIIVGDTDPQAYENLVKIAPTIMLDTFAALDKRITELGDLFGKKQEAADWLKAYDTKAAAMWKQLHETVLKPGETASVFTYYPGDRLFVMARAGLPQLLYGKGGFKATAPIQKILDAGDGFKTISLETIEQVAGDHIFILGPVADEAKQSTEDLLKNPIWKSLPAVKKGHVYSLDILKSDSDAYTRKWLLEELPKMLSK